MIAVRKKEGRKEEKEQGERGMAQLFGYHNSVGGSGVQREPRKEGKAENEQADKNEEQTWQSIGRTVEGKERGKVG